jgi:hypothetical protein
LSAAIPVIYRAKPTNEATHMLAEKFLLLLETIISRTYPDGSPIVVSTSRHVPLRLPTNGGM